MDKLHIQPGTIDFGSGNASFGVYIPEKTDREKLFELHQHLTSKARKIMESKNHDYSSGASPYANFEGSTILGISPETGILLRMLDKIMRLKTFAEKGELKVQGEGVEDALIDIINYAVLFGGKTGALK